ncbi:hypothetical protein QYE76_051611 [Lolium multiflorum]|uniref:Myb-like domain-containing protein n=1 Tax=Lolium multiflorum TaxID=4521 RepID=A0AAD8STQ4_LOLMU|nr:hypothetical protein QYE76_051611 [Lolium multiflorum]
MPPPSASAARFAAHWVVDALAGDETLHFSAIEELVGAWPESLAGAPEATRERVALRCLQEAVEGAALAGGERLRVDATRSCEEFLIELIGQVGSSESLEMDMLPHFSDIQKFIRIKIPTLLETCFDLLREVNPEITSMVAPSPVEKSAKNNVNDKSFCSISRDHVNTEKHGCPRDSSDLQRVNLTAFVNGIDTRDVQKDPMEPIPDLNEPSTLSSRRYDQPQENTIDYRDMPITAEPASATCSDALLQGNTELLSKKDAVETTMSEEKSPTTNLQPRSCGDKYQNPSHNNDGERPHNDGIDIQSSKDLSHQGSTMQSTVAPDSNRSTDALPTCTSEKSHFPEFVAADDTVMVAQPLGRKTRNSLQHDHGEKASQDLDEGSAKIQLVEKYPGHNELNLQTAGAVPSVSCYVAVQEDKSETNHPQEDATDHSEICAQMNGDKVNLGVSSADKANPAIQVDGNILKKNTSCGGQTAIDSPCCNVTTHNKSLEVNSLSEKNAEKNMADRSAPSSHKDGNKEGTNRAANKKIMGNAVVETSNVHCSDDSSSGLGAACLLSLMGNLPSSTQDRDADGSIEQDLCIKCGKDGQLLKCSSCALAAHDSCFGSSVTFDVSGKLYCPVCFYNKANEAYQKTKTAYSKARKNLFAFLGTKQHDEQFTGKEPTATCSKYHLNEGNTSKSQGEADDLSLKDEEPVQWRNKQRTNDTSDSCHEEDQLNGCNTSKRQCDDQSEADKDEEPAQQRKKQRKNDTNDACPEEDQLNGCNTSIKQGDLSHQDLEPGQHKSNATTDTCTEEVITENASLGLNSDIATNKDCVLHYKRTHIHVAEHGRPVENAKAHEDGNDNSFYEVQHSSQSRSSPVTSQNVEADKHDGRTNSHECENSDEIEATSSNDSRKQSSPPWRNMRHHKARLQKKHTVVSHNFKKASGCQDEHMPSPSKKRNYAPKRYSNPLAPGRRSKLCWTEEEEQALRDAMLKFTPKDDGVIPWVRILEYGSDVFHKTRLPSDLRVKWRNMKKKS